MPLTLAIANQKGGVGKTSTTINLASLLSRQGKRVLVIDADPQGNATTILGVDVDDHQITLNDVLDSVLAGRAGAGDLTAAVVPAGESWPGIDVIPADRQLAARDADTRPGREAALRLAAEGTTDDYDVVLIDCPPSLGVLALGALTAADRVLIVTEPRVSSVDGVAELLATTQTVRRFYNPTLTLAGIVINRWRSDRADRVTWRRVLHETYPESMIDHPLPEREVIATAATNGIPLPANEARDYQAALAAVAAAVTA